MKKASLILTALLSAMPFVAPAENQPIKFGDMNRWVTRKIKESGVIGGDEKTVYEIGPTQTINGAKAYVNLGGSPWATSNVYAKVMGVVKTSNAVYPADHPGHGKCARLTTTLESCKVLGLMNIEVLVSGSIFLGQMMEPIANTSSPYSKMEMGIPYTGRPKAMVLDLKVVDPGTGVITRATTGTKKTRKGTDSADVFIYLQRRWEDEDGNLHAKRVGTARKRFVGNSGWREGYRLPITYGDASAKPGYRSYMKLLKGDNAYYARNSKGKMVPVQEEGWDSADATPTHMIIMCSAGSGVAYEGQLGMELWVDNIGLEF
ncbi:MAG: PCMD domain-containing protein [Muribaculaceae bacterium]|nr:PCMD domain-containing protein [Muribaculaceae bacterium]